MATMPVLTGTSVKDPEREAYLSARLGVPVHAFASVDSTMDTAHTLAKEGAVDGTLVWTAAQAVERGLVDELGGLHTAVRRAKRAQGIDEDADVALVPYPQPMPLMEQLSEILDLRIASFARRSVPLPNAIESLRSRLMELPLGTPLLIPPIIADIH